MTISEKIRNGSDSNIALFIAGYIVTYLIGSGLLEGILEDHRKLILDISGDVRQWLREPAEQCIEVNICSREKIWYNSQTH